MCSMKKINLKDPLPSDIQLDYQDKHFILMSSVKHLSRTPEAVLNDSFILVLVEGDEGTTIINDQSYTLKKGDLLVCPPGNILFKGHMGENFRSLNFIFSKDCVKEVVKGTNISSLQMLMAKKVEILQTTPDEQDSIRGFYRTISSFYHAPNDIFKELAVHSLHQSFAFFSAGLFYRRGFAHRENKGNAAEVIFRKFASLLKEHPEGRTVQYFADKLNITPKYFNSICKQVSGRTASSIINEEVVSVAQIMLNDHDLSIKQISSILGFANQSHFGSFMRRETGMSPQAIRNKKRIDFNLSHDEEK